MVIPAESMSAPAESRSISAEPIQRISPRRRVPGMPDYWQQFSACVIFHMILPFSPIFIDFLLNNPLSWNSLALFIDFIMTNPVSEKSITLSASMYVLSIGVSSRNVLTFCVASVLSTIFAIAFGFISAPQSPTDQVHPNLNLGVLIFAGILSIFYISERYNRHIVSREPFLVFMSEKKGDGNAR